MLGCGSLLEYHAALCLIYRPDFADLREQVGPIYLPPPNHLRAPLWLDFLLTDTRGRKTAISVKPEAIAVSPYFKAQMQPLRAALVPNQADRLVVITEANISRIELENAKLMHAARFPVPEVDRAVARTIADLSGPLPLEAFLGRVARPGKDLFGAVRALRHGTLAWRRSSRITPQTLVWPAEKGPHQ